MKKYELVYNQPYDCDHDSPSGFGDHVVEYEKRLKSFEDENDEEAKQTVKEYLKQGGLQFGSYYGSGPPGLYPRKFVSLHEVVDPREVIMEEKVHVGDDKGKS